MATLLALLADGDTIAQGGDYVVSTVDSYAKPYIADIHYIDEPAGVQIVEEPETIYIPPPTIHYEQESQIVDPFGAQTINTSLPPTTTSGGNVSTSTFESALIASRDARPDNVRRLASTYGVTDPARVLRALLNAYTAWNTPPENINVEADAQNVLYALGLPGGSLGWSFCNTTDPAITLLKSMAITYNNATRSEICGSGGGGGIMAVGVTSGGVLTGNTEDVTMGPGSTFTEEQVKQAQTALEEFKATLPAEPLPPVNTSLPTNLQNGGTSTNTPVPSTSAPVVTAGTAGGAGGVGGTPSLPPSIGRPLNPAPTVLSGQTGGNALMYVAGFMAILILAEILGRR